MPTDAELLKVYLADRDVPCPGCSYNLRGCVAGKCPECGLSPLLGVQQSFWTPGRVRLTRATLLVLSVSYGFEAVAYASILWRPGTFVGVTPIVAAIWVVVMTIHALSSIVPAWAIWRTMGIPHMKAERRLNLAFGVALCVPLVRGSLSLIQMIADLFV